MSASSPQLGTSSLRKVKKRLSQLKTRRKELLGKKWEELQSRLRTASVSADENSYSQSLALLSQLAERALEFEQCLQTEKERAESQSSRNQELELQLSENQSQIERLLSDLSHSQSQSEELTLALESSKQNCEKLSNAIQNAELENMASSNALTDAMSECSSIAKALEESEHQNEVIAKALTALREEKAALESSLETLKSEKESIAKSLDELKSAKGESSKALADAKHENAGIAKALSLSQKKLEEALQELNTLYQESEQCQVSLRSEIDELKLELADAKSAFDDAESKQKAASQANQDRTSREAELLEKVTTLEEQVSYYQNELDVLRQSNDKDASQSNQTLIEELRSQLLDSRRETIELRMQANDLASQLASSPKSSHPVALESMSWEERKRLLLKELESVPNDDVENPTPHRLEMEELIAITQREVERRDEELSELRRIIEQQSSAREGMAVGAAAIAQLLDSDELVRQEREKLKGLQEEWETKARQVEIELSRERAKLARERLELDARVRSLPAPSLDAATDADKKNQRGNWLARLGLNEQQKG